MSNKITTAITPEDVLANYLGLADPETVKVIAEARRRHDPTLTEIETELGIETETQDEDCAAQESVPESVALYLDERLGPDATADFIPHAVDASFSERPTKSHRAEPDGNGAQWALALADWFHLSPGPTIADLPSSVGEQWEYACRAGSHSTLCGDHGKLASCDEMPLTLPAEYRPTAMKSIEIPCIRPDAARERLAIRQWASELEKGVVTVFAAKLIAPDKAERYHPQRVELRPGTRHGKAYWYQELSIRSLIPDLKPGDRVLFYAEPATEEP